MDQHVEALCETETQASRPAPIMWTGTLLSIHMQSNRPGNFVRFLDRLEGTAHDPSSIEVVVKIDDTDAAMNRLLPEEVARRRLRLKYISTPLPEGFYGLWRSMDDLFRAADLSAYFILNLNDEMSFATPRWDLVLRRYVGLFPDHIFRLRTSVHRARNYYDFWEAGFANDTSAIITRRWLEIGGGWCPCNGPDTFQECVAFYLGYHRRFSDRAEHRDIPIHDIEVRGHGALQELSELEKRERISRGIKPWYILMSHAMQQEASRRSQRLQASIWAYSRGVKEFDLVDNRRVKGIDVVDRATKRALARFDYRLSRLGIVLTNCRRRFDRAYFCAGGDPVRLSPPDPLLVRIARLLSGLMCVLSRKEKRSVVLKNRLKNLSHMPSHTVWRLVTWFPSLKPFQNAYMQARLGNPLAVIERPSRLQKLIFDWTLRLRGVKEAHE